MVLLLQFAPLVQMVIHWRQWWYKNGTIGVNGDNGNNGDPLGSNGTVG
jgi:hypothetical protein